MGPDLNQSRVVVASAAVCKKTASIHSLANSAFRIGLPSRVSSTGRTEKGTWDYFIELKHGVP